VVEVVGEFKGDAGVAMQRTLADALGSSLPAQLIVDLSGVNRVDAGGINALAASAGIAGEGTAD
jgi:anti-anti-sigma regulatory factor